MSKDFRWLIPSWRVAVGVITLVPLFIGLFRVLDQVDAPGKPPAGRALAPSSLHTVYVSECGSNAPATLWVDDAMTSILPNPFPTRPDGSYAFSVNNGCYTVVVK